MKPKTILELTGRPGACDPDPATNRVLHDVVRADAETGAPSTSEGRALLATARPWPDTGMLIGKCRCGSSLMFDPPARREAAA